MVIDAAVMILPNCSYSYFNEKKCITNWEFIAFNIEASVNVIKEVEN